MYAAVGAVRAQRSQHDLTRPNTVLARFPSTGTPATAWGALSWRMDDMASWAPTELVGTRMMHVPHVPGRGGDSRPPAFVLRNEEGRTRPTRPNEAVSGLGRHLTRDTRTGAALFRTGNVSASDFASSAHDRSRLWYHTSLLAAWPQAARAVMPGLDMFALALGDALPLEWDQDASAEPTELQSEALMWVSHPGVISQPHYDQTQNMFIQLVGRKRIRLLPPKDWRHLQLFPSLHPSYRQSQARHLSRSALPAESWLCVGAGPAGNGT